MSRFRDARQAFNTPPAYRHPTPRRLQGPLMPVSFINLIDTPGRVVLAQGTTAADGVTDASGAITSTVALAGSGTAGILFLRGTYRIKTNVTIPANVTAEFAPGATLNIDAGKTVTFAGPVDAGPQQIFTGAGTATFGAGVFREIFADWWGGGASGQTAAVAAAVAGGEAIVWGGVDYPVLLYQGGLLVYLWDDDGFTSQAGHNSPGTHVLQNSVDTPASGTICGHWAGKTANSLNNYHTFAYALVTATDVTSTSMDSTYTIGVMTGLAESGANMQPNAFFVWCGSAAPSDANLANNTVGMYLDQGTNTLKFRVRYSNGTLKTGSVALT